MNTSRIFYLSILVFLFFQACTDSQEPKEDQQILKQAPATNPTDDEQHKKWFHFNNFKPDSLSRFYTDHAVKILPTGKIINGNEAINTYYLANPVKLDKIKADTLIMARKERGLQYEIGEFSDTEGNTFKHLLIWKTDASAQKREFEFIAKMEDTNIDLKNLDERRTKWMELCNQHNATRLIKELYTKNTIYFSHRPVVQGQGALVKEYTYMNDQNYNLSLNPIIVDRVNNDFIFEIGQCVGSYGGKYILIWKKDKDGKWRIFIDSNI